MCTSARSNGISSGRVARSKDFSVGRGPLRHPTWLFVLSSRILLVGVIFSLLCAPGSAQQASSGEAESALARSVEELRQQIQELRATVAEMKTEASEYRAQSEELRKELEKL